VTPRRLVLFDIDGTLLLTSGAGRRAITAALAEQVSDISGFQHVRFDGKTDPQIVSELLHSAGHAPPHDAVRVEALCRRYVTLLETELSAPGSTAELMPGIRELLARLAADDAAVIGVLTGNLIDGARLKLRAAGLDPDLFRVGAFGSDSAHRPELPAIAAERARPLFGRAPSGHDVVIIGDTPADVACGAGIGARAIAVATGAWPLAELEACGPFAAFADLADTDAVIRAVMD
jgi:phosphoglycolate phosphatase-like HAD superfamily hydrolase